MDVKDWRSGTTIPSHDHYQSMHEDDEGMEIMELKRGPWTAEEDLLLINYIANHGEGRWNSLALSAGLKRTGKSCRLRWLNYLKPDVRRGNITPEEQLLILQLHFRWGNRWSKIAQYLPGRTDNEIKNYWRTRVQKQAKQLRCDVNSKLFKDTMRYIWIPRLAEKIQAAAAATTTTTTTTTVDETSSGTTTTTFNINNSTDFISGQQKQQGLPVDVGYINTMSYTSNTPDQYSSTTAASSVSFVTSQQDSSNYPLHLGMDDLGTHNTQINCSDYSFTSPSVGYFNQPQQGLENHDFGSSSSNSSSRQEEQQRDIGWLGGASGGGEDNGWENFWSPEDIWFLHQQL